MKRLLILFVIILLLIHAGCGNQKNNAMLDDPVMNQDTNPEYDEYWKDLYSVELRKHITSFLPKFNLYDLDGNGTPELLISDDNFHGASAEIFTADNGDLIKLGDFGSWGEFQYNSDSKYIFGGMTGQGCTSTAVYKIENNVLIELVSFFDNTGAVDDSEWTFEVNGKSVSQDEFYIERDKYGTSNSDNPFARKYDVTESEITRILG